MKYLLCNSGCTKLRGGFSICRECREVVPRYSKAGSTVDREKFDNFYLFLYASYVCVASQLTVKSNSKKECSECSFLLQCQIMCLSPLPAIPGIELHLLACDGVMTDLDGRKRKSGYLVSSSQSSALSQDLLVSDVISYKSHLGCCLLLRSPEMDEL